MSPLLAWLAVIASLTSTIAAAIFAMLPQETKLKHWGWFHIAMAVVLTVALLSLVLNTLQKGPEAPDAPMPTPARTLPINGVASR